ncbi:MAG: EamA family transporter [Ignavibacteriaceae bacterium]
MRSRAWLIYAITVTVLWGVWGALIEIPEKAGFPATLGYSVWALTMIPVTLIALKKVNWQLNYDKKSIIYGMLAGLLGSGGQLILFQTLRIGPAYIVFPIISLYPVVTIILSIIFLKERASIKAWIGIVLALIAILLLSYVPPENSATEGLLWLILAITVFIMWGIQAYIIKLASSGMNSESITFYTMSSAIVLTPIAFMMTNFSEYINWGMSGSFAAIIIQSLNAVGFLFFAYAIKYGKAIIVVPMMSLAPVITVIISLILYSVMPHTIVMSGMIVAFIAIYLMAE